SSRRRHTISKRDWSSDVCSSDLHFDFGSFQTLFAQSSASLPVLNSIPLLPIFENLTSLYSGLGSGCGFGCGFGSGFGSGFGCGLLVLLLELVVPFEPPLFVVALLPLLPPLVDLPPLLLDATCLPLLEDPFD